MGNALKKQKESGSQNNPSSKWEHLQQQQQLNRWKQPSSARAASGPFFANQEAEKKQQKKEKKSESNANSVASSAKSTKTKVISVKSMSIGSKHAPPGAGPERNSVQPSIPRTPAKQRLVHPNSSHVIEV